MEQKATLSIQLTDFVPRGIDYVDYWAVCFGYKDIFKSDWQAFRTKKHRHLELVSAPYPCEVGDIVTVAIKVVDAFANDFTRVLKIGIDPKEVPN